MTITTVTTAATPYTTITNRDYAALYVTRKDIAYKNILKKSKKSLRLSSRTGLKTTSRNK